MVYVVITATNPDESRKCQICLTCKNPLTGSYFFRLLDEEKFKNLDCNPLTSSLPCY